MIFMLYGIPARIKAPLSSWRDDSSSRQVLIVGRKRLFKALGDKFEQSRSRQLQSGAFMAMLLDSYFVQRPAFICATALWCARRCIWFATETTLKTALANLPDSLQDGAAVVDSPVNHQYDRERRCEQRQTEAVPVLLFREPRIRFHGVACHTAGIDAGG